MADLPTQSQTVPQGENIDDDFAESFVKGGRREFYTPPPFSFEQKIRILRDKDFVLESKLRIPLRWNDCFLILFYEDTGRESRDFFDIISKAAMSSSIAIFGAVNLRTETGVANALNQLKTESNNPLNDFAPKGIPSLIVYRGGFPQAHYNGYRSVSAIIDFALTIACDGSYHEREQKRLGADIVTYDMGGTQKYINSKVVPDKSTFFNYPSSPEGLRYYNPRGEFTEIDNVENRNVQSGTAQENPNLSRQ